MSRLRGHTNRLEQPTQGIYQGNGAGPIIWAVVSSLLLQILREDGYGTHFEMALTNKLIRLVGYAFVDNTDLIQMAKPVQVFDDVFTNMQEGLNLWEGLIKNTQLTNADGGVLTLLGVMGTGATGQMRNSTIR